MSEALSELTDEELFFSVGSHRPTKGGLLELIRPASEAELLQMQAEFDAAKAEMLRRDKERGFPYYIPR